MFFVDDSNIWIEARKFAASGNSHMPKLTDCDCDPRLRIDIGRLVDMLRGDRLQGPSSLYGSRPPPNDSVWKVFELFKFKTKIYDRVRGKEKEVDNSMATDLSSQATELSIRAEFLSEYKKKKANTTFVVITGDRDMLPPIKKVLESDIRVELWAWDSAISAEYLKLAHENPLLSVKLMNWIFAKISFTNFRSTRQSKNKAIDPAQAIVLCEFADPGGPNLESFVCEQLLQLGRLFYTTLSETDREIFVEFPRVRNIEAMVRDARELFKEMLIVRSWPEHANRFDKDPPAMVETSNMYAPLKDDNGQCPTDVTAKEEDEPLERQTQLSRAAEAAEGERGHGETDEMKGPSDPDGDTGWQTVARSDLKNDHRRIIRQTQQCSERIRCKKRGDCGYRHSNEERDIFRDNPRVDFRLWKTRRCNRTDCFSGKRCSFAHVQNEAWCLRCRHEGHYTEECQYKSWNVEYNPR